MSEVTMSIKDSTVSGTIIGIKQDTYNAAVPDENAEILRELQRVRKQLETTEPMIADALATLEEAVKTQDKPTIKKLLGKFAGGTTKAVLAGVASKALLSWMGIA